MILLMTTSTDETINVLIRHILDKPIFRFNFDLWRDYSVIFSEEGWSIEDPVGRKISSDTVSCCMWWKAFNALLPDEEPYVVNELKYIFKEIYNHCERAGITFGSRFDYHNINGKLNILQIAKKYFPVPVTSSGWNMDATRITDPITKSLSSYQLENKKVLYAQKVEIKKLAPQFPWTFQNMIDSDYDITIFQNGKSLFAFRRSRADLPGIDWRVNVFVQNSWIHFELDEDQELKMLALSKDLGVNFGRYDFMSGKDNSLVFLELNATGQWMFLDPQNELGIIDSVVNAINHISTKHRQSAAPP